MIYYSHNDHLFFQQGNFYEYQVHRYESFVILSKPHIIDCKYHYKNQKQLYVLCRIAHN